MRILLLLTSVHIQVHILPPSPTSLVYDIRSLLGLKDFWFLSKWTPFQLVPDNYDRNRKEGNRKSLIPTGRVFKSIASCTGFWSLPSSFLPLNKPHTSSPLPPHPTAAPIGSASICGHLPASHLLAVPLIWSLCVCDMTYMPKWTQ